MPLTKEYVDISRSPQEGYLGGDRLRSCQQAGSPGKAMATGRGSQQFSTWTWTENFLWLQAPYQEADGGQHILASPGAEGEQMLESWPSDSHIAAEFSACRGKSWQCCWFFSRFWGLAPDDPWTPCPHRTPGGSWSRSTHLRATNTN